MLQQEIQQKQYTSDVYIPPVNAHYTQVYVDNISSEIMKVVIGKQGKVFKAITHQAQIQYIWYNIENKYIEIWGPEDKVDDAWKRVYDRIRDILKKVVEGDIKLKETSAFDADIMKLKFTKRNIPNIMILYPVNYWKKYEKTKKKEE